MTVKNLQEAIDEKKERIWQLLLQARRQSKPSWRTRNRIVSELARLRQLEKDLSRQLAHSEIIGFEL